jgi:hypothetical protein
LDTNDQLQAFMAKLENSVQIRMNLLEQGLPAMSSPFDPAEMERKWLGFTQKLDHVMQTRMNLLEQRLQTLVQSPHANINRVTISEMQEYMDGFKKETGNLMQIRFTMLEQEMQIHPPPVESIMTTSSPSPVRSISPTPASVSGGSSSLPEIARSVTALVQQLTETFQQKLQTLDAKLSSTVNLAHENIQAIQNKAFQELATNVAKTVKASQSAILKSERQYASALRQTMVRLHNETRSHTLVYSVQSEWQQRAVYRHEQHPGNVSFSARWNQYQLVGGDQGYHLVIS